MKDDIFFVWKLSKKVNPEDFKTFLNSIEPRIQFTLEMEKDRTLNFTDLTIIRLDRKFVMKVYRKDTHTNKYINWRSNVPTVTKVGSMKTLIFRAYDLCTEIKDRNEELDFLKDTFIANDYPVEVVDRIFDNYIPQKYRTNENEQKVKPQLDSSRSLYVPYVRGFSDMLKRELRKEEIDVIFSKGPTLEKKLCKLTPKIPIEMSKDNIYRKHCTECTATYIGESGLTMKQRDTLHRSDIKTGKTRCALYTHMKNNKGHNVDWEKKEVLDRERDFEKRKIKEALYINALDDGRLMNPDKGIPINECWTEFFPNIRKLTYK